MPLTMRWGGLGARNQWGATAADRVDWVNDTIKIALITNAVAPNQDTHDYWNDLSANEIAAGSGYTAGGATLASKTLTYDAATNEVRLDCADPSWPFTASKTFRYAVVYKDTGSAATSSILGTGDFGADETTSNTFTITVDATGLLKAVAA